MLAVSVVTYAVSYVLIRTISRYREYAADRGSALITGAPEYLMSALQKIASGITQIPQQDLRQVEGMNAFFIVPTNWRAHVGELFMDHPPLEKRLAALSEIAREMGRPRPTRAEGQPSLPWACGTFSSGRRSSPGRLVTGCSR